ncbi:polymeric immunoglobulin receptor-like isoform X3 [Narcine bancroftii]|uniref:polymeric immunoglobulin receptor-like isoform X3 n=1 Tax=Narcine bancroftii TaxID=1343680 RepID=UPI003831347E
MEVAWAEFTHQKQPSYKVTIALLLLISVDLSSGSTAITGPKHVKGEEGQSVTVECRYDRKYRDYKKQWCSGYYNLSSAVVVSTDRPQNGRSSMTDNKAEAIMSVTIDNLQKEDEGLYWCVIEKIIDEKFLIHLQVSEGSTAITGPKQVKGEEGQSVTMECRYNRKYRDYKKQWCSTAITGPKHVKGEEGQSVTVECRYDRKYRDYKKQWCSGYYNLSSAVVVSTDRPQNGRSSMTDNKAEAIMSVTIDNLQKEDEGLYWCVIEKIIDEKFLIHLQVSEGSTAITGPKQVKGEEGQSVTMECRYNRKYRDYKKQWCRGHYYVFSSPLVSTERPQHGRLSMTDNMAKGILSFTIDNLQKKDKGRYWCGIDKYIDEKFPIDLEVYEGSIAITGPKHVKGEEGQSITMECRYDRKYRDYKKQWCSGYLYLSRAVVVSSDRPQHGRSSMTDNKTEAIMSFTIDNLQKEDEGWYWCVIEKMINEKISFYLQVSEDTSSIVTSGPSTFSMKTAGAETSTAALQTSSSPQTWNSGLNFHNLWAVLRWLLFKALLFCTVSIKCMTSLQRWTNETFHGRADPTTRIGKVFADSSNDLEIQPKD